MVKDEITEGKSYEIPLKLSKSWKFCDKLFNLVSLTGSEYLEIQLITDEVIKMEN